ncbi:aspartate kinase [Aaosphaeria arxii CBS 175.79]|uniref:Aspartokinase n=1 Tax=Aaosphaeria arxii CBS 175.79 TaxID=1450172 RepID=A0A6A5XAD7_9PLEO|nr:aspartate kinase [Aaosphaeria arxii CBS 175.79]KAF2009737.1 aspartate kinase [Aaosphaeria arxii CBS 175.79]
MPIQIETLNGIASKECADNAQSSLSSQPQWVVQKFGGTSIGKFPTKVKAAIIGSQRLGEARVAVVCSARSDASKDTGTTSRLFRAIHEAQLPGSRDFEAIIATIKDEHFMAAERVIGVVEIVSQLFQAIEAELAKVSMVLRCVQQTQCLSEHDRDFIISRGEKLSCLFLTALFRSLNVTAVCIDLYDLLASYSKDVSPSQQVDKSLFEAITQEISSRIDRDCKHGIPIITGFFGGMPGGLLKSVGRGYSDLCAALVAVSLGAQELQIWKEVDGVFNADPRKVPTASLLKSISPSEAAELAFYGAEVIHPSTMEHVMQANIPIRIKNVMNPGSPGTKIEPVKADPVQNFSVKPVNRNTGGSKDLPIKPVAVSVKQDMVVLNIQTRDRSCSAASYLAKIFAVVEQHNLKIDLISSSEMNVSLAVRSSEGQTVAPVRRDSLNEYETVSITDLDLASALQAFDRFGTVDILANMAIISLIGDGLKQMTGTSAKFFNVLADNDINIEMISQGASETNISAVIEGQKTDKALIAIHRSLFSIVPETTYPRIAGGKGWYLGA